MIFKALNLISHELNEYFHELNFKLVGIRLTSDPVVLYNISQLDSTNSAVDLSNKVVMTLVNMSEESSLKNMTVVRRNQPPWNAQNPEAVLRNPILHVNLYVLFVANSGVYGDALSRIGSIVRFFQGKNHFAPTVPPNPIMGGLEYKLMVDLHSMTLEELNNLWGMLGGKQLPSVLYRIRLVELEDQDVPVVAVPLIKEVHLNPQTPPVALSGAATVIPPV